MLKVISIVPRLPPAIDGVGDYALRLAEAMHVSYSLDTQIIVGAPKWQGERRINTCEIHRINQRSKNELLKSLTNLHKELGENSIVFLNLAIYGYARWGTPFWLVSALEAWKKSRPDVQIITMFHELSNPPGVPWRHMFWTARAQIRILQRIFDLSDVVITSNIKYANSLRKLTRKKKTSIEILPVCSNIGELSCIKQLQERRKRLVIFGQSNSRINAYQKNQSQIHHICQDLKIEEIIDIGPKINLPYNSIGNLKINSVGQKSAEDVSLIMANSVAGFIHYNSMPLAKSGIFAAYSAHGMLPIVASADFKGDDGLLADFNYFSPNRTQFKSLTIEIAQPISQQAYKWYSGHSFKAQASFFASILERLSADKFPYPDLLEIS